MSASIMHSIESSDWYTPRYILEPSRNVLGGFDFDPWSDASGNTRVGAKRYRTAESVDRDYLGTVWDNPPNPPDIAWRELVEAHVERKVPAAIYLAYNIEQVKQSQQWTPTTPMTSFSICIPFDRIAFDRSAESAIASLMKLSEKVLDDGSRRGLTTAEEKRLERWRELPPATMLPGTAPPHSQALIGINVDHAAFVREMRLVGYCMRGERVKHPFVPGKRSVRLQAILDDALNRR